MPEINFSLEEIKKLLFDLDTSALFILKHCADEVSCVLKVIFTRSLSTGILPLDWQKAKAICPIFKKGRRDQTSNYRLIFLLYVQK